MDMKIVIYKIYEFKIDLIVNSLLKIPSRLIIKTFYLIILLSNLTLDRGWFSNDYQFNYF